MDLGQIFDQSNKIERNKSINNDFCSKGTEKSSLKYKREEQNSKKYANITKKVLKVRNIAQMHLLHSIWIAQNIDKKVG